MRFPWSKKDDPQTRTTAQKARDDQKVLDYVSASLEDCKQRRSLLESDWVLSAAFEGGRQWLRWDSTQRQCEDLRQDGHHAKYVTDNQIRWLMDKVAALATTSRPDSTTVPEQDTPLDHAASAEGAKFLAHNDREFAEQVELFNIIKGVLKFPVYRKVSWNPAAMVEVPKFDESGQRVGKQLVKGGWVDRATVNGYEIYLDPVARCWSDCQILHQISVKPLSWFKANYPDKAADVQADASNAYSGYIDQYLPAGLGGMSKLSSFGGSMGKTMQAATLVETWDKTPTDEYPNGRFIVSAGGTLRGGKRTLLYEGEWPCQWRKGGVLQFPFIRYVFREAVDHPYGETLIPELIPIQMAYNRALTHLIRRLEEDKLTVVIEEGAQIGADAYEDSGEGSGVNDGWYYRKIYHKRGSEPPKIQTNPPASPDTLNLREWCRTSMQDKAGIHDVTSGTPTPGVTTGIGIELLQQGDRTALSPLIQMLERNAADRGELELSLIAQYAIPGLPVIVGSEIEPGKVKDAPAATGMLALKALTGGGSCKVLVEPGSATPRTPAGKNQEVIEWYNLGLYGPPGSPEAAQMCVRLLSMNRQDEVLEHLQRLQAEQKAQAEAMARAEQEKAAMQAQSPADVERMKQEGALAMQRQSAETDAALAAQKDRSEAAKQIGVAQATAEIDTNKMVHQRLLDLALPTNTGNQEGQKKAK